jgi:hypothetical protein
MQTYIGTLPTVSTIGTQDDDDTFPKVATLGYILKKKYANNILEHSQRFQPLGRQMMAICLPRLKPRAIF